jgi:predicted kinase
MRTPVLVGMCGLPRSGKSTQAAALVREYAARGLVIPIVNPDSIRLALHGQRYQQLAEPFVWATAQVMVRALFLAGHRAVILDATNTTRQRRETWLSPDWETEWHVLDVPTGVCIERAGADLELVGVIRRMAAEMEWPEPDEGTVVEYKKERRTNTKADGVSHKRH